MLWSSIWPQMPRQAALLGSGAVAAWLNNCSLNKVTGQCSCDTQQYRRSPTSKWTRSLRCAHP
jgi:hypothetical protein